MQPRLIRLRDAPNYLGMDRNRFNKEVRPCLTTLKIGKQGVAFDRIDLDQWADAFKKSQEQLAQPLMHRQKNAIRPSLKAETYSPRIKKSIDEEFEQIVKQLLTKS